MKTYKLVLTVEAENDAEAADKLFDELYNGDDNMSIQASDMTEVQNA